MKKIVVMMATVATLAAVVSAPAEARSLRGRHVAAAGAAAAVAAGVAAEAAYRNGYGYGYGYGYNYGYAPRYYAPATVVYGGPVYYGW